ncbi:MAG: DUF4080 domain-containing protein [Negativicutes bacterium]|jgi:radical SAM superfamily enzyme YgiQ (UPF0313 family)
MNIILATLNSSYVHSNLALRYLRAQASADGILTQLVEYTINTRNELILRDLVGRCPDVVAFSVYIWNIQPILELIDDLKKYLPSCRIILGGPEVSFDAVELLRANPAADFILVGEVENQLSLLLTAIGTNENYREIPNLCYRSAEKVIINDSAVVKQNFDCGFPYILDDFKMSNQIIYYESSRGCPYNCSYCLSAAGRGVRYRDNPAVIAELQWLIERKPKQIKFVDRTFNAKPEHYLPIMRFLANVDTPANFHFEVVAELITDELLEIVATAPNGRFQFEAGLQSFNSETLRAINRTNNYATICERLNRLRCCGKSHLHVDLIAGLPYERYQDFARSFDKAYAIRADMLQLGFLKLLKGAPISQQIAEHGYLYHTKPPYEVIANNYLSAAEVLRLKAIEAVLETFKNAGRATFALDYLAESTGSVFSVYEALGDYWREHRLYLQPHKLEMIYNNLLAAVREKFRDQAPKFAQLLKQDIYRTERTVLAGNRLWFDGNELREQKDRFFRNAELREKYCPGFAMASWRNLRNNFEIGIFAFDARVAATLFDYRTQPTIATEIDAADFGEICYTTNIQTS